MGGARVWDGGRLPQARAMWWFNFQTLMRMCVVCEGCRRTPLPLPPAPPQSSAVWFNFQTKETANKNYKKRYKKRVCLCV